MALSNWDLMAFGSDGKPDDGILAVGDATVRIYKNWLYVGHEKMWHKSIGYSKPTIAQINHGDISLAGFEINATRHDGQDSVFCFASFTECTGKGKNKHESRRIQHYMAGIGCYGYMTDSEYLAKYYPDMYNDIDSKYWNDDNYCCCQWSECDKHGYEWHNYNNPEDMLRIEIEGDEYDLERRWVGVKPETAQAFFKWLQEVAPKEYYDKIGQVEAMRFNQGDAYFANNLGTPLNSTKPGESEEPIIGKMMGD